VHFHAEHEFAASPAEVARLLLDPDFHTSLELPDLARPTVVATARDGDGGLLRLRYEYVGQLDPIARRMLGSRELTWIQDLRLDPTAAGGTLSFAAEGDPDRLRGDGRVTIEATAAGSRRRIAGELVVRVPLVGPMAERKLVPGIVRRLDLEAEAVRARLESSTS
jgi:hypothetical protein